MPAQRSKSVTCSEATFASCRPSRHGRRALQHAVHQRGDELVEGRRARGAPLDLRGDVLRQAARHVGRELGVEQRARLGARLGGQALGGADERARGARGCWGRVVDIRSAMFLPRADEAISRAKRTASAS